MHQRAMCVDAGRHDCAITALVNAHKLPASLVSKPYKDETQAPCVCGKCRLDRCISRSIENGRPTMMAIQRIIRMDLKSRPHHRILLLMCRSGRNQERKPKRKSKMIRNLQPPPVMDLCTEDPFSFRSRQSCNVTA